MDRWLHRSLSGKWVLWPVNTPSSAIERRFSPWIGGSILASLVGEPSDTPSSNIIQWNVLKKLWIIEDTSLWKTPGTNTFVTWIKGASVSEQMVPKRQFYGYIHRFHCTWSLHGYDFGVSHTSGLLMDTCIVYIQWWGSHPLLHLILKQLPILSMQLLS